MTQPTQALPPYLSASTFTTSVAGMLSTGVVTVEVPITYFGPSIPLGTNGVWTFGGSTSPPSTAVPTSTAPVATSSTPSATSSVFMPMPTSTVTAIPTISPSSTANLTPPVSSSTQLSSSSSSTGNATSISAATSTSALSSSSSNDTVHRALPGIIIGSIIGALWLVAMVYFLYRWCIRRRQRRNAPYGQSNFSDFVIVDADGGSRVAGEGVARPTGGEEDSFLRRGADGSPAMTQIGSTGPIVTVQSDAERTAGVDRPSTGSTIQSGRHRGNPFFGASDASIFYNPRRVDAVPTPDQIHTDGSSNTQPPSGPLVQRGPIIAPERPRGLEAKWQREREAGGIASHDIALPTSDISELGERPLSYTPLRPPPVLNPDAVPSTRPIWRDSVATRQSHPDSPGDESDERATLLTARRVLMNDAGPSTLITVSPSSPPSNWLGLGELARLRRMSWFQRMQSAPGGSAPVSRHSSQPGTPREGVLGDPEQRAGLRVFDNSYTSTDRPLSYLSVYSALSSSGNTIFHDARSSISTRPGTPSGAVPPVPPIPPTPRSFNPSSNTPRTPPPDYSGVHSHDPQASEPTEQSGPYVSLEDDIPGIVIDDVLDTPPPAPVSPFSTTSTRSGPCFPPGLEEFRPNAWRESNSDMPTAASFGTGSDAVRAAMGGDDALEDAPPHAGTGWTSLRTAPDYDRRYTLGQPFMMDHDFGNSEHASIHSMGSHLSPLSPVASGSNSRSASRHTTHHGSSSYGSGSSRSARGESGSLVHSTSISSDGRRRARREPGEPALGYGRASLSAMGRLSPLSSPHSPAHNAMFSFSLTDTTTSNVSVDDVSGASHATSSNIASTTVVDGRTGAVMHFPTMRWTSGQEADWPHDAWTEIAGSDGARWWGPPARLFSFQRAAAERQTMSDQDVVMYT